MSSPRYFRAWLIFFLVATAGGAIAGGILGGFWGAFAVVRGVDPRWVKLGGAGLGFLAGIPISFFTFRWCVAEFVVKPLTVSEPPKLKAD